MGVMRALQNQFGFTRNELNAVVLLTTTLVLGAGIKMLRSPEVPAPPSFDYRRDDSVFLVLSRKSVDPSGKERLGKDSHQRTSRETPPEPGSVNLNTATKSDLVRLPGIGAAYAERILERRQQLGRFRSIEQLVQVKGIGKRRLEKIRPFLRINKE